MRIWNVVQGTCKVNFFGATKEITTCAISNDSRVIYSSGFDNKTTIWNTVGQIKSTTTENLHVDAISKMRASPSVDQSYYVTVSWDGFIKIWNQICDCQASFKGHDGPIYALDIEKTGQYFITGGKDGKVKMWKYSDLK